MLASSIPSKMPTPWASSALASYIRAIAATSQIGVSDGQASYPDGFVPLNFAPVASGGVPPFGKDANGILNAVTQWLRWVQAGGTTTYDAAFQTAIGGYPLGARVESAATSGLIWRSTTDGNTTNPDTGGAGWSVIAMPDPNVAALRITATSGSTGANVRFEGNGTTTPNKTLRARNGAFQIMNSGYTAPIFTLDDAGNLTLAGGATLAGNAIASGTVQGSFVNSTGTVHGTTGIYTDSGHVQALGGALRAALGATGSGDPNRATLLNDFPLNPAQTGYMIMPNGLMIQWGFATVTTTTLVTESGLSVFSGSAPVTFPLVFPNSTIGVFTGLFEFAPHIALNMNVALVTQSQATLFAHSSGFGLIIEGYWMAIGH